MTMPIETTAHAELDHEEPSDYMAPDLDEAPVPFDPGTGPVPGYVAGRCGHRVAASEWRAGFRVCERCPDPR